RVERIIVPCRTAAPNHIDVEVRDQLRQRHNRIVVRVVFRAVEAKLFAGVKYYEQRSLRPRAYRERLRYLQHRHRTRTIIVRAVIDLSLLACFQVIVMCAENDILVLKFRVGAVEYPNNVLRRRRVLYIDLELHLRSRRNFCRRYLERNRREIRTLFAHRLGERPYQLRSGGDLGQSLARSRRFRRQAHLLLAREERSGLIPSEQRLSISEPDDSRRPVRGRRRWSLLLIRQPDALERFGLAVPYYHNLAAYVDARVVIVL